MQPVCMLFIRAKKKKIHVKCSRKRSYICGSLSKNITKLTTEPCPITAALYPGSSLLPISTSECSLFLFEPLPLKLVFYFLDGGLEFLSSGLRYDSRLYDFFFFLLFVFPLDLPWVIFEYMFVLSRCSSIWGMLSASHGWFYDCCASHVYLTYLEGHMT